MVRSTRWSLSRGYVVKPWHSLCCSARSVFLRPLSHALLQPHVWFPYHGPYPPAAGNYRMICAYQPACSRTILCTQTMPHASPSHGVFFCVPPRFYSLALPQFACNPNHLYHCMAKEQRHPFFLPSSLLSHLKVLKLPPKPQPPCSFFFPFPHSAPNELLLEPPDENTLRIMIATDNHVGFLERDPVRGPDSFAALEGRSGRLNWPAYWRG